MAGTHTHTHQHSTGEPSPPAAHISLSLSFPPRTVALATQNHYQGTNIFAIKHTAPFLERFRKVHVMWDKKECNPPDWQSRVMP